MREQGLPRAVHLRYRHCSPGKTETGAGRGAQPSAEEPSDFREDDILAIEVATEFGKILGSALANLAAACDPEVIVIGGGVSRAGEVLLGYIEKPFQQRAFFANKKTRFCLAELGNDAGICGAAKLVLDVEK